MSYAEQENLDGLIFVADIEKAFDSMDHNFIFASLEKYGCGPDSFNGLGLKHYLQTMKAV